MGLSYLVRIAIALLGLPRATRLGEWVRDVELRLRPPLAEMAPLGPGLVMVSQRMLTRRQLEASVGLAKMALDGFELRKAVRLKAIAIIYRASIRMRDPEVVRYLQGSIGEQFKPLLKKVGASSFLSGASWGPEIN